MEDKNKVSMNKLCNKILEFDNVRFAGLISNYGNLYAGGFKEGVIPYENDEKRRMMYMRFALESCFRKDFDDSLGDFKYSIIQRAKVSILMTNICNYLLLVFVQPEIDIQTLAGRIQTIIDDNKLDYSLVVNHRHNHKHQ